MAGKKVNRIGMKYGRLLVIGDAPNVGAVTRWTVRCDCGTIKVIRTNTLTPKHNATKSCGCYERKEYLKKHGMSGTATYRTWQHMLQRCYNKSLRGYKWWGGRGIRVTKRWHKFENFIADMGERPPERSIDRINNDGNYEPGNCRWATRQQQRANQRNKGQSCKSRR